mmetsp:Transcript_29058/g.39925  ORF Transcript_29058/g.39925 Transcript_29058/m.39925 type:complete len:106 (-) Transcript_29058:3263-3580(-)
MITFKSIDSHLTSIDNITIIVKKRFVNIATIRQDENKLLSCHQGNSILVYVKRTKVNYAIMSNAFAKINKQTVVYYLRNGDIRQRVYSIYMPFSSGVSASNMLET